MMLLCLVFTLVDLLVGYLTLLCEDIMMTFIEVMGVEEQDKKGFRESVDYAGRQVLKDAGYNKVPEEALVKFLDVQIEYLEAREITDMEEMMAVLGAFKPIDVFHEAFKYALDEKQVLGEDITADTIEARLPQEEE